MKASEATTLTEQTWVRLENENNITIDNRINSGCYDTIFNLIKQGASNGRTSLQTNNNILKAYDINITFLKSDLEYLGYVVETEKIESLVIYAIYWHKKVKDV